jgi:iron complex outermembrane recepter protein
MTGFLRDGRCGSTRRPALIVCAIASVLATRPSLGQTSSPADSTLLDEVVVTARKIEEQVQDIPISVQVLSGEFLDAADLSSLYELQFNVPGLVVNNVGGYGAGFSLRGIADQGGTTVSVATHLNGVYMGTSNLAIARMFDLQRIEILKGPQGTLYGRNSTGGLINFITRPPEDKFDAELEAAYGSFDTARLQGFVNLPSEKIDFRLAFIGSEGDGFIHNTEDSRKFSEDDYWGLRASLRIAASDKLQIDLVAQRVEDTGASGDLWLPNPEYLPDPGDLQLTTVTLADPYLKTQSDVVSADIEYDLGFASLRSITGYAHSLVNNQDDCAGNPAIQGCVRNIGPDNHRQWSQEFQLASSGDDAIGWLAGAYYYDANQSSYFRLLVPVLSPMPVNNDHSTSAQTAFALYGQASLPLAEHWNATGGLRLSRERSDVSNIGTGIRDNLELAVNSGDWDDVSWHVDLEYTPTDELLVYGGISTGFKSGGVTTDPVAGGEFADFKPEDLIAYEAGIKSASLDRRLILNASAFLYDFSNLQVTTVVFDGVEFTPVTDNAAKAEIYGIDSSATFAIADRWTLSAGLIWLPKRDFIEYINPKTGDSLSGKKLSRVPEWTATGAIDYVHPLREAGTISARIEYNYRSDYFFTKENDPVYWQDGFGLLNVFLNYESANSKWYVFASGRNLTDEDYFTQVFIQSAPGYPDTYELGFGLRF